VHGTLLREEIGAGAPRDVMLFEEELRNRHGRVSTATPLPNIASTQPASVERIGTAVVIAAEQQGTWQPSRFTRAASSRGWVMAGALVVLAIIFGAGLAWRLSSTAVVLDPNVYVVLPFLVDSAGSTDPLHLDRRLNDALTGWRGVHLVGQIQTQDEIGRSGLPVSLRAALAIARNLHARNLIWGQERIGLGTTDVEFSLYDVRDESLVTRHRTLLVDSSGLLADSIARVARQFLLGALPSPGDVVSKHGGTSRVDSWRAYAAAHAALQDRNFAGATSRFREAVETDPDFAMAHLWLAQILEWAGADSSGEGRQAGVRALALRSALDSVSVVRAQGLSALATGDYGAACAAFRALIARDSLDSGAWYGLGDCQARDSVVIADSRSKSGWSFRGSYHEALGAYTRAFELMPSLHFAFGGQAFARLSNLLFTEAWRYRPGVNQTAGSSVLFAAFPSEDSDTLAFVPFPIEDIREGRLRGTDATHLTALRRNRAILLKVFGQWASRFPSSPEALEAYALGLELAGQIVNAPGRESATAVVRRALAISSDTARSIRLRLIVSQVRLALKSGDARTARTVGEALLRMWESPRPNEALELAGVAALLGRVNDAASYLAESAPVQSLGDGGGKPMSIPRTVTAASLRLLVFSSFGFPSESLTAAYQQLDRQTRAYIDAARQESVRAALLRRPLRLAYAPLSAVALPLPASDGDPLIELQRAVDNHDVAAGRNIAHRITEQRRRLSTSDIAIDQLFREAVAELALGDTTGAIRLLDDGLEAMPGMSVRLVSVVPTSAGIVQAMALRSELASQAGDFANAKLWADRVHALWSKGDRENREIADRVVLFSRKAPIR
jgi:tetratricopeptide (TPR) repeat protein